MSQRPHPWRPPTPLPDPIATTPRLVVRWYTREDVEATYEVINASRGELWPWLPWSKDAHKTKQDTQAFIERTIKARAVAAPEDLTMAIADRVTGKVVGGTGLHRPRVDQHCWEVGYWMGTPHAGKGYCTEAVAHLLSAAFSTWQIRRIRICCAAQNAASVRVIEKLGARLEARFVDERWVEDRGWCDALEYALLDREWDTERHALRST